MGGGQCVALNVQFEHCPGNILNPYKMFKKTIKLYYFKMLYF